MTTSSIVLEYRSCFAYSQFIHVYRVQDLPGRPFVMMHVSRAPFQSYNFRGVMGPSDSSLCSTSRLCLYTDSCRFVRERGRQWLCMSPSNAYYQKLISLPISRGPTTLPNETLQRIGGFLKNETDLTHCMMLSRRLLLAMAPVRYQRVVVRNSMKLFLTIAAKGPRSQTYAEMITSIVFKATDPRFDLVSINVLSKALMRATRLRYLSIDIAIRSTTLAEAALTRYHIIRTPPSFVPMISGGKIIPIPPTPLILPSLHTVCISRCAALVSIAYYRNVTTLWLTWPVHATIMDTALEAISDTRRLPFLTHLGVCFDGAIPTTIIVSWLYNARRDIQVLMIGQKWLRVRVSCFTNYHLLLVLADGIKLKTILSAFAEVDRVFPRLTSLILNTRNPTSPTPFIGGTPSITWLDAVAYFLRRATMISPRIQFLKLGPQIWTPGLDGEWSPCIAADTITWWENKFGKVNFTYTEGDSSVRALMVRWARRRGKSEQVIVDGKNVVDAMLTRWGGS